VTELEQAAPGAAPAPGAVPEMPTLREVAVGVDGSPGAERALEWAAAEADRAGARLTVIEAWSPTGFTDNALAGQPPVHVEPGAASAAVGRAGALRPHLTVRERVEDQAPVPALLAAGDEADLLVVGSRGYGGFRGLLLGSVGQHCLAHARCPVAIVRPAHGTPWRPLGATPGRIVVGVDGSQGGDRAVDWAVGAAHRSGAHLEVVGSWVYPGTTGAIYTVDVGLPDVARQAVDAAVLRARELAPDVVVEGGTSEEPAAVALVARSRRSDMVVVGSRGVGAFRGLLLGSVSLYVATHARCPVVVVKPRAEADP
jgi:nucleotide-binding universal stress UspA family protein